MRKTVLLVSLLFIGHRLIAQQLPQYTQYTFNELLINPAVTGIESYWDVKAGYRSQWSSVDGAPTTAYFTASIPLGQDFTLYDYSQMIRNAENATGRDGRDSYLASASHSGISFSVISDKAGAFKQTHINMGYAYHLRMSDSYNLGVGASLGVNSISLNTGQLTLNNPIDPAIGADGNNQLKPEVGIGLWFYGASYFLGASTQQLLPVTISYTNSKGGNTTYSRYFFTGGVKIYPSDDVTLLPSVVVKPNDAGPLTYDLNLKVAFRDAFWIGGAYRKNDAIAGSVGFNLNGMISLGYSYDYSKSDLGSVVNGAHEIMIGILLNNNYNTVSQKHTW